MISFKSKGFDKLGKYLKRLEQNARKMDGKKEVPLSDLLNPAFMRKHTQYSSVDSFLEAGGFHAKTGEELKAIPEKDLDLYITRNTRFKSWADMINDATDEYISKHLGF